MDRLCNSKVVCDDPNIPVTNYSSEAPEIEVFISSINGVYGTAPALGSNFTTTGCLGVCEAPTQEQADACALASYTECVSLHNKVPPDQPLVDPPGVPPENKAPTFINDPQTCTSLCPDGSPFSFTVPAGRYTALTQAAADAMAHSFACQQAILHRVCIGTLSPTECCSGSSFSGTILVLARALPITFSVVSGSLPPGVAISQPAAAVAQVSGTPNTPGTFNFRLRATDPLGDFMEKNFTISVVEIANSSPLPAGSPGSPYSVVITLTGTLQAAAVWSISAGALPAGLTLDSATGEISGTPTGSETDLFTVSVTDGRITCHKDFTLTVASTCPVQVGTIAVVQSGANYGLTPTRTAAIRRIAAADVISGPTKVRFINTATDAVAATINFNTGGYLGCFATSQSHFFLKDGATLNNIVVFDQNGVVVATIVYPQAPSAPAYSAGQDRVYATTLPGNTHVRGVNPATNAIVSDTDLGFNYAANTELFVLNEHLVFDGFLFFAAVYFFSLPGMAAVGNVPTPGGFAGGACYAPNAGKYLVGAFNSGTFNAEVWQINAATFAIEHVYTPTDTGNGVFSLEYNPITGKVIGKQTGALSKMVIIDPVAQTIVCEFTAGTAVNAVIDQVTGKIYTVDDAIPQALIYQ